MLAKSFVQNVNICIHVRRFFLRLAQSFFEIMLNLII